MKKFFLLKNVFIKGRRVYLRKLELGDISQRYISWLNNPKVNKFLSSRDRRQTSATVKRYVNSFANRSDKLLLGVFLRENNFHIGNLTLSHIDWQNNFAAVGICIGDRRYAGMGYGIESIECLKKFIFKKLNFIRLEACVCEDNTVSVNLFKKAGFEIEGHLRCRGKIANRYVDGLMMGLIRR